MRPWILLSSLLLTFAVLVPVRADDQQKDNKTPPADKKKDDTKKPDKKPAPDKKVTPKKDSDDTDEPADKPEKKEKLRLVGSFVGKLERVDNQAKKMVVGVPVSHFAGDLRNLHIDTNLHNVDVYLSDDVLVRRKYPPPAVDDRGRRKRYTRKELKELRGPKGSWGYNADFDDLKPNEVIEVFLGRHKGPAHNGRLKRKELEKELANPDNRPVVFKIYILVEPFAR